MCMCVLACVRVCVSLQLQIQMAKTLLRKLTSQAFIFAGLDKRLCCPGSEPAVESI